MMGSGASDLRAQARALCELQSQIHWKSYPEAPKKSVSTEEVILNWWAREDSNFRPLPCQGSALTN